MKLFVPIGLSMLAVVAAGGRTADSSAPSVLVELFTSEGCSSCPPADELLQQLDATQPVPGAQLIVLSEHVDYWDHDGWKDPYSSKSLTDRQSGYTHALALNTPYTPEIIIDGAIELKAHSTEQVIQTLQEAATTAKVPLKITSIKIESNSPGFLRAHIEADGTMEKHSAEVFAAVALDHAESQVMRGENSGRRLAHVAVVQDIVKVGKLEKQKTFAQDVEIKLKPGTDPQNIRIVCFVQESALGKVRGSATRKIAN